MERKNLLNKAIFNMMSIFGFLARERKAALADRLNNAEHLLERLKQKFVGG